MTSGRKRPDLKIASDAKRDRADDLLGAVVPSRARDIPPLAAARSRPQQRRHLRAAQPQGRRSRDAAAGNRRRRPAGALFRSRDRQRQIALLIGGSLLIHGAIFAAFNREPEPHASIGMIVVSAEIVLGGHTAAGSRRRRANRRARRIPSVRQPTKPADDKPEVGTQGQAETPVEEPKERPKTKKPRRPRRKTQDALPVETRRSRSRPSSCGPKAGRETDADSDTGEKKPETKETKEKKVREAARHAKEDGESLRDRAAPASAPSTSSSCIGRGRSDLDTNYLGIVAAHLALTSRCRRAPNPAPRAPSP